ncbi:MAG: hypothetical protein H6Q70_1325 [Firmicutes bacterium]|nr:hypothetical protein [Bacillota bacterium]
MCGMKLMLDFHICNGYIKTVIIYIGVSGVGKKLITGKDDAFFCQRISALLDDDGYFSFKARLTVTDVIVSQVVMLKIRNME